MEESKKSKTGAQIERVTEDGREKIVFHKSFYISIGLMVFLTVAACILFFFIIQRYEGFADAWNKIMKAAQPIIIGLVVAYLLNPIMKFWERTFFRFFGKRMKKERRARRLSRGLGIGCAILVLLLIIVLFIAAIAPSVISSIAMLIEVLPGQVQNLVRFIQAGDFGDSEAAAVLSDVLINATNYVETWAQEDLLPLIQSSIASITTGVINVVKVIVNFVIGLFVAAYVMSIQETLQGQSKKLIFAIFRPRVGNIIVHTVRKSSSIFGGFITGKIIDSAIIGGICYVGCLILHIPSPILVAVIVGVTNIIPFFGPFIGAIPALLLVVIQSPWHALYLLIFIIVLQQVDGNIIGPKILGNSTGLSSFWVMFAILVFGGIWGFFGMLLGVPIMAVIYYIVGKLVRYGLARRKLPTPTADYVKMRGVNLDTNTLRYTPLDEFAEEQAQGAAPAAEQVPETEQAKQEDGSAQNTQSDNRNKG
ncbi:MAG: AI-2E family transporter [Agathobacter sp.]|nr:AI-2E family transporter [Agathobacter sp.]